MDAGEDAQPTTMMQHKSLGKVQMDAAKTNQWTKRKNTGQRNVRKTVKITFDTTSKLGQHESSENVRSRMKAGVGNWESLYCTVLYTTVLGLGMPGKRLPVDGGMQCFGWKNREKRTFFFSGGVGGGKTFDVCFVSNRKMLRTIFWT